MAGTLRLLFVAGGLLVCGTFNSLIAKLIYGIQAPGVNGHVHYFRKPWFQTTNMFLGMTLCMAMYYAKLWALAHAQRRRAKKSEGQPLLVTVEADGGLETGRQAKKVHLVLVTSVADLAATGLMFSGLVFTTASVYQMLRGAQVVFCAILSILFLNRQLDVYQKLGILFTILGISLVGSASLLRGTSGAEEHFPILTQLFGILLIVLAQLLQAVQMVLEEWLLQDVKMDALELAGWEGIWGGVLCVFVILPLFYTLPGSDMGSVENTADSLLMLRNNGVIIFAEAMNCLSVLSYNYFGLTLTQDFTAMHRVIIEASRSLLVWASDLLIFYALSGGTMGESWEWSSWIQLGGFAVLLAGTFTYNYTTLYAEAHYEALDDMSHLEPPQGDHRTASAASRSSVRSRISALSGGSSPMGRY